VKPAEVIETMASLRAVAAIALPWVSMYAPFLEHLPVQKYWRPEFDQWGAIARKWASATFVLVL